MKLLLDEMFSPLLADALRQRGHDVVAVAESTALSGKRDSVIFAAAVAAGRALVTNNVVDYVPLCQRAAISGQGHSGLLLTSDRSLPRDRPAIGRSIKVLDALQRAHPSDDALRNRVLWVSPTASSAL